MSKRPSSHTPSLVPSSYHNKFACLLGTTPTLAPSNAHDAHPPLHSAPHESSKCPGAGLPESTSERERRRPHAPSMSRVSSAYHVRDPRWPPRHMETGWALLFRTFEEENSLVHVWMFYITIVLFPLRWFAAFGACQRLGSSAGQTWRRRCHWVTHRSGSVRSRVVYACCRLLNVDRSAFLALPLSRHGEIEMNS
jgi:hypothetical protein